MTTNDKIKEKYRVWSIIGRPLTTIDSMLNEARADQTIKLKSKFRNILHAFANDPDKSFKHIDEILKNIEVD